MPAITVVTTFHPKGYSVYGKRFLESFAARVAGSLLTAIELPELITTTEKEYEALALSLATDPDKFMKIKSKLAEKKNSASLFDAEAYTKNLELAYVQAYKRYKDGLPPAEFKIS